MSLKVTESSEAKKAEFVKAKKSTATSVSADTKIKAKIETEGVVVNIIGEIKIEEGGDTLIL